MNVAYLLKWTDQRECGTLDLRVYPLKTPQEGDTSDNSTHGITDTRFSSENQEHKNFQ